MSMSGPYHVDTTQQDHNEHIDEWKSEYDKLLLCFLKLEEQNKIFKTRMAEKDSFVNQDIISLKRQSANRLEKIKELNSEVTRLKIEKQELISQADDVWHERYYNMSEKYLNLQKEFDEKCESLQEEKDVLMAQCKTFISKYGDLEKKYDLLQAKCARLQKEKDFLEDHDRQVSSPSSPSRFSR